MTTPDHARTLDRLREMHRRIETGIATESPAAAWPRPSFTALEAHARIGLARRAAESLGINSPFFREIEDVTGPQVTIAGTRVVNFAAYDYLSLNQSEGLADAVHAATARWGVSATASRLVGGEHAYHRALERDLATFLGTEDAVTFVSGYLTNASAIRTLMAPGDLVLVDARAHNSIYEGIRVSGAEHLSFPHNDWHWVEQYLTANRARFRHVLIAIEGLYSMDGDLPDLRRFADLKDHFGAWLMVDEAHAIGVLGKTGRGLCEEQDVPPERVDIRMGTLSKTFCSCGGFLAGTRELTDVLRYTAPGFVYSVGLSAPNAAAAAHALGILRQEPARVARLRALAGHFQNLARARDLDTGDSAAFAVQPVLIGDSLHATRISEMLLAEGFNVLPIVAPAVPNQSARLRFFLNAGHDEDMLRDVLDATARLVARARQTFRALP